MLALIAPGQGAQKPGMLTPWLDLPGAAARVRWLSTVTGLDLLRLGTTADAAEIKDTAIAQPLIVAMGLIAAAELPLQTVPVVAGHSVGELTAAALAGVISPEAAVALAAARGREMAAACAQAPTGMSAVLGGDPDDVVATIERHRLTPANRNGAGQIVAAGLLDDLAALSADPPAKARVIPLPVAGAFHTRHMAPAEAQLAAIADGVATRPPERTLLSNADGTAVSTAPEVLARIVRQVTSPVRWDLCQETFRESGIRSLIELPPAGTLTGLAKRELRGIELLALNSPDDLAAARELIAAVQPLTPATGVL